MLQSHEIESDHSDQDQQPTTLEADVEGVVNPDDLLPLSGHIESELNNEVTTTDVEELLGLNSLLPSLCGSNDLVDMEMDGQMEADNTQVEGQAFDVVVNDEIMDLFSDDGKQSNFPLVTYSDSSGSVASASPSFIAAIKEILCYSKNKEQSDFKFSDSLKRLIESALNVPYGKKPHTSSVRKGISERRKRYMMTDICSSKKIKLDTIKELSWLCDIKGLTFEGQSCCCGFCNFSDFNLHGKNFPLKVVDSLKWKQNKALCQWCEENVICVADKGHCLNKVDFVSCIQCKRCCEKHDTFDISKLVTCDDKEMLSFVPYGSGPSIMICTIEKPYVDLNNIDHMSECFSNLYADWNLCWNDMLYGGIKLIDLCLNFSDVDAYAVDKFVDFVPETVMNIVKTVTPDSNLINFDNIICSQLVESHSKPLDLPKESYMYMYEVSFDTIQDYCKRSIGWPELWLYNEFPGRCIVMSKASESCIISEAEGFNVPIEVQPMYEYFTEMYDYTNFI